MQAFLSAEQLRLNGRICPPQPQCNLSWISSPDSVIKINWDSAICKHEQKMGMGFLVCDFAGRVLAFFCATKPHISDSSIVEAISA